MRAAEAERKIALVAPTVSLRESFLRALREFQREGLPWWFGADLDLAEQDFAAFVAKKRGEADGRGGEHAPKTNLWAVADEEVVGRVHIHHALNEALRVVGGHIGYDTVPSFRGRGVAKEMLRLALPVARGLGLSEVLITCDETNVASIRVIESNGGALRETRALEPGKPGKRYYGIELS